MASRTLHPPADWHWPCFLPMSEQKALPAQWLGTLALASRHEPVRRTSLLQPLGCSSANLMVSARLTTMPSVLSRPHHEGGPGRRHEPRTVSASPAGPDRSPHEPSPRL
jgi:hypothetical protein